MNQTSIPGIAKPKKKSKKRRTVPGIRKEDPRETILKFQAIRKLDAVAFELYHGGMDLDRAYLVAADRTGLKQ